MLYDIDKTRQESLTLQCLALIDHKTRGKLNNIAASAAILFTTFSLLLSLSAYTYPELYPKSLGNANDIDSFKSGIFYMKVQQPGKSTPINSGHQLDKKEFYQAIQKYGETSKADASAGNVAQYIVNNQGTITVNEAATLSAQLNADGITATPT